MQALQQSEHMHRAAAYRLFARLWQREVDAVLLHELCNGSLREAYVEAGGVPPRAENEREALEILAVDFCRLFVGPSGHLPPCQSVWSDGQFHGRPAASMQRYLDVSGYDLSPTQQSMVDHLSVQLDLMGHILQQMSLFESAAEEGQDLLADMARTFFRDHLTWPQKLFDAAARRAETDFYRRLVRLTADFLRDEAEFWTNNLPVVARSTAAASHE